MSRKNYKQPAYIPFTQGALPSREQGVNFKSNRNVARPEDQPDKKVDVLTNSYRANVSV
jgi:hypothetical protein